ncbi:MAG: RNA methyltransferase [Ignavibacteriota bacterium]
MKKLIHSEIAATRLTESDAAKAEGRFPLIAILDNIRSMYNVGSIFRTSDGARIEAIFTVGFTPHPPRKEIEKTALDATRTVPFKHFPTMEEAIKECRSRNMKIAALELTDKSRSIFDVRETDFPMALIIGNEITGVSEEALAYCEESFRIPMFGAKHSLNVAVAYGIAVFECIRAGTKNNISTP